VLSEVQIAKYEITVPVCIIKCTDNRAFGIRGYILHLLKYQDFWCISTILKELYCITEAPSCVLKVEL
jgi:hypothetical protein